MTKSEMLKMFCGVTDDREYLNKPIRRDGYLYATNGHIGIRIDDDPAIDASETQQAEKLSNLFGHGDIEFHELPELPPAVRCKTCKGTGQVFVTECDECDGDGEFYHGSHYYECKECDGSGKINGSTATATAKPAPCDDCGGSGESISHTDSPPIKVGALHFQRRYLRKISSLPNARIEHVEVVTNNNAKPAQFIFDGGEGIIMPVRV